MVSRWDGGADMVSESRLTHGRKRLDKPGGPVYHNSCPKTQKEDR